MRRGRFRISMGIYDNSLALRTLLGLFEQSELIGSCADGREVEYIAISEHFRDLAPGEWIPIYEVNLGSIDAVCEIRAVHEYVRLDDDQAGPTVIDRLW